MRRHFTHSCCVDSGDHQLLDLTLLDGQAQPRTATIRLGNHDNGVKLALEDVLQSGSTDTSPQIDILCRTPSAAMSRPRPRWTTSPRSITRYWSAMSAAKS